MRFTISLAVLTGTILGATAGCSQSSACDLDPAGQYCSKLPITAALTAPTFYVDTGGMLTIHVSQLSSKAELMVALTQGQKQVELLPESLSYKVKTNGALASVKNNSDGINAAISKYLEANPKDTTLSNLFFESSLTVLGSQLTGWTESPATIQVTEKGTPRDGTSEPIQLRSRFDFQATRTVSTTETGTITIYPKFQKIGYIGTELYALMSGGNTGAAQKVFRYKLADGMFTNVPLGGALTDSVQQALIDFAGARFFLLANSLNLGLQFYNCPREPNELTSATCDMPGSGLAPGGLGTLLPLSGTTALAVSPDATLAAVAVHGTVYTAAIPPVGTPFPVLSWQSVPENATATGAVTQLALDSLGGPSKGLLVMRAGKVWLYSGTPNNWTLDPASDSLQEAVGSTAVKALAVGDLDSDGLAEVVVVKDAEVIPIAKVGSRFLRGRPLLLPDPKDSIVATAVTIGQVDKTLGNDIVVASTTKIDGVMFSRHLDAFLNKR